ncbi:MAG: 30S ribosomal protein S8e [Nanoarchaeota archaeon]
MNRGRKISGGKYHKQRKRKLFERPSQERHAILGEVKSKKLRVRSGKLKTILLKSDIANIIIKGKAQKAKILNVIETPQNRFYARQNRLLKSALIQTSLGKAKITNRPTQEGQINAILIEENK